CVGQHTPGGFACQCCGQKRGATHSRVASNIIKANSGNVTITGGWSLKHKCEVCSRVFEMNFNTVCGLG
ncbi:hypothetical protein KA005_83410, partial [bacterium]|nr:hypothetical protein [bacterium]